MASSLIQRWYFRKLMATVSLFLGIDSALGLIHQEEFFPPWN